MTFRNVQDKLRIQQMAVMQVKGSLVMTQKIKLAVAAPVMELLQMLSQRAKGGRCTTPMRLDATKC